MNERGSAPPFPERIGRYDLLLPIAAGGMGAVYLARMSGIGGFQREVALKLMHAHLKLDPALSRHLIQEANLAVRIRHPNVVSVLDVGEDPFGIYLVMDYIEGDTLNAIQRLAAASPEGNLPLRFGMKLVLDSLAGLQAAHELKDEHGELLELVHRDFSPQNVLVGIDGIGRLTDFGIAKATTGDHSTTTGIIKGKIAYMSPEQARGEKVDRRADVWAAGVVAWQIIAGRRLYPGKINEAATLLKVAMQEPPHLREVKPDVPIELDEVIAKALKMKLDERYPTAHAFKQALAAACRALGESADDEEVAAFVRELVEPIVKERRGRAKEISELRARMGRLAETSSTSESGDSSPVGAEKARANALVHEEETALGLNTADIVVEATRTDGTSVSDSLAIPKPKLPRMPLAAAAVVVLGAALIWIFGGKPENAPSAADAPVPTTSSSGAPTDSALHSEMSSTPIAPPTSSESQTSPPATSEPSAAPRAGGVRSHAHTHAAGNATAPSILPPSPYGSKK